MDENGPLHATEALSKRRDSGYLPAALASEPDWTWATLLFVNIARKTDNITTAYIVIKYECIEKVASSGEATVLIKMQQVEVECSSIYWPISNISLRIC
jgi:hypothetical protein